MRPRPSAVSFALLVVALLHAWWGAKLLLDGSILTAMSQFVGAGGLLLASVGARSRTTFATGLFVAAGATSIRVVMSLQAASPFLAPTAALAVAFGLAAWGASRLEEGRPGAPAALRIGLALVALAYAGFAGTLLALGGGPVDAVDLVVRAIAAAVAALFVDAPPVDWARAFRRKRLDGQNDAAS